MVCSELTNKRGESADIVLGFPYLPNQDGGIPYASKISKPNLPHYIMMKLDVTFFVKPEVWIVLKELSWGDRFEHDLSGKVDKEVDDYSLPFKEVADRLVEAGICYRFKGGKGNPYLTLTEKGWAITEKFLAVEDILNDWV